MVMEGGRDEDVWNLRMSGFYVQGMTVVRCARCTADRHLPVLLPVWPVLQTPKFWSDFTLDRRSSGLRNPCSVRLLVNLPFNFLSRGACPALHSCPRIPLLISVCSLARKYAAVQYILLRSKASIDDE